MPNIGQQLLFLRPPLIEALIIGLLMKHQRLLVHFLKCFFLGGRKAAVRDKIPPIFSFSTRHSIK